MGDVVSLVERAAETIQVEEAEKLAAKMARGKFDLDDLWAQLRQMQRMGGLGALAGMMPGLKGMKGAMDKAQDSKALVHMEAMLSSMTAKERAKPELINAKRKIRVAKGSGTDRPGNQQADEDASGNGDGDEAAQEDGWPRQARRDVWRGRRFGRSWRSWRRRWNAWRRRASRARGAGGAALPGLGGGSPFNLPPGFDKFSKK